MLSGKMDKRLNQYYLACRANEVTTIKVGGVSKTPHARSPARSPRLGALPYTKTSGALFPSRKPLVSIPFGSLKESNDQTMHQSHKSSQKR